MNKKFIFIGAGAVVLLLIIVLVATSCGGTKKTVTDPNASILTIWGFDDPANFSEIISNFQDKNKGYKVVYVKKDPTTYAADSLNEIAAGKGPDVWAIPNTWLPKYHDKLVPMPANLIANKKTKKNDQEVYKTLFPNVVAQDNIIDNNIYGMPLSIDNLVLYCNRALLRKAMSNYNIQHPKENTTSLNRLFTQGPKTWDDFVTMTKLITQKDGSNVTLSAVALGTADNVNRSSDILTLLMMQDGAKMTSDDLSTAQFHTKQNVFGGQDFPGAQALNFYAGFANPETDLYTWNSSMPDSIRSFAEGKAAMMIDYTSAKADIKRINPNLDYNFFAVPQVKETKNPINYSSYMDYTVTRASKNQSLAWQLIVMMTTTTQGSSYNTKTHTQSAKLSSLNNNPAEIISKESLTAQSWYMPDPAETPIIFKNTIKQVNESKNPQTAIEYAGSQITTLLGKLKQ